MTIKEELIKRLEANTLTALDLFSIINRHPFLYIRGNLKCFTTGKMKLPVIEEKKVDSIVIDESVKTEWVDQLDKNIQFFKQLLLSISTVSIGIEVAIDECSQMLEQLTNESNVSFRGLRAKRNLNLMLELLFIRRVAALLNLSNNDTDLLIRYFLRKEHV